LYGLDAETGLSRTVVSGRGVTGALSPDGERIVYEAGRPPLVPSSFFVMDRDGSRRRELDALAGLNVLWSEWSPDGRSIAYWEHGVHFSDSSIRLLELSGSSPPRTLVSFPEEDPCNPRSSPLGCVHSVAMDPIDGRIAYATFEPKEGFDGTTQYAPFEVKEGTDRIHVIDPDDGAITLVATSPATGVPGHLPSVLAWSPDGSRLAFAAGCRIWSIAPGSTDRELLVDLGSCPATPEQLTWSPDGTELAFIELNRTATGVLDDVTLSVLTVDGAAVRTLGTFGADDAVGLVPMAWQPIPISDP
jgi:Tol biopolymer transport system component